jgi:FkbM family methyltransferase
MASAQKQDDSMQPASTTIDTQLEQLRQFLYKVRPDEGRPFDVLSLIETYAQQMQGKGWGAVTVVNEVDEILRLFDPQPILAIDVGGNVGDYTAELIRRIPDLEVHVFEPSRTNTDKLSNRYAGYRDVHVTPLALSDNAGTATLFSNEPGSGLSSLTKRELTHFGIPFECREQVDTIRFEDYWRTRLQARELDVVKIDVEGHELGALRGFGSAVDATKVFQFEFGGCNIDTRTYFRDFYDFFDGHGFAIRRVTPLGLQPIERYRESDEFFSCTNFLAVNRRHLGT